MRGREPLGVGPEGSRQVRVSWSERYPGWRPGVLPRVKGAAASRFGGPGQRPARHPSIDRDREYFTPARCASPAC